MRGSGSAITPRPVSSPRSPGPPTLLDKPKVAARKIRFVDPDPAFYLNARIRISDHSQTCFITTEPGTAHPSWQTKGSSKKRFKKIRIVDPDPAFYLNARIRISDHSQTCFITTEPVCPDAPGPPTLLDKPKVAEKIEKMALQCCKSALWIRIQLFTSVWIRIHGAKLMRTRILVGLDVTKS